MQQYTNCGSTPAAVSNASDFVGLQGKCGPGGGKLNMGLDSPTTTSALVGSATSSVAAGTTTSVAAAATGSVVPGTDSTASAGNGRTSPVALVVAVVVMLVLI